MEKQQRIKASDYYRYALLWKIHEKLLMILDERLRSEDMRDYYCIEVNSCDLNYDKFVVKRDYHRGGGVLYQP